MTYQPNTPQTGDSLGSTRDVIRTNFQQIAVVNAINHIAFNESDKGKHKYVQLPEVTASGAGVPSTAADEGALYSEVQDGITNLFWRLESDGAQVQMTGIEPLKAAAEGYTFLPGGLLLQWGSTTTVSTAIAIVFPVAFSTVYQVIPTIEGANRSYGVTSVTNNGFTLQIESPAPAGTKRWIAIGAVN